MKRVAKQNLKQTTTKSSQPTQLKTQVPSKPSANLNTSVSSLKAGRDSYLFGSQSYKRQQKDMVGGMSAISNKFNNNNAKLSKVNTSATTKNVSRQPQTSIAKNTKVEVKKPNEKKITDLSEILKKEENHQESFTQNLTKQNDSPLLKEFKGENFEISPKSFSPISNKHVNRELGLSPEQSSILDERQMLLRSGNSASSNEKSVLESIIDKEKELEKLKQGSGFKKVTNKSSKKNSRVGTPNRIIFNDSLIKENTNICLNSNLQFKPVILLQNNNRSRSPYSIKDQKSPSVNEIQAPFNNYYLKISDITNALSELEEKRGDNADKNFELKFSPSEKQEEFQTLILNQTNPSTGLQSHEFSLVNNSMSMSSSNRNSLASEKQAPLVEQPKTSIKALLRNILVEGQVLWEVQWSKLVSPQEETTFESEEDLKEKYNSEFNKLKALFFNGRSNNVQ